MVGSESAVVRKLKRSNKTNTTSLRLWLVEIPGWLLLLALVVVQAPSAIDYHWGVRAGFQESQEQITPIGVAFNTGCARTDVAVYIPLLAAGLIGYGGGRHGYSGQRKEWGRVYLTAAVGMTLSSTPYTKFSDRSKLRILLTDRSPLGRPTQDTNNTAATAIIA